MVQLVNLTPHGIAVQAGDDGNVVTIPPSGNVARVSSDARDSGLLFVDGTLAVPTQVTTFGQVIDLPTYDPEGDVVYVVSGMVLSALREQGSTRCDVVAPATGPQDGAIRNEKGHIVAVTKFNALI